MHIPLWTTLLFAARHNGPELLERTGTDNICLPFQLQTVVPSCALQCLQTFIASNYNTQSCTSTADISFLCTNPTISGLTIGEGSLQCVISSCFGANIQTQSGYTVCNGVSGALPNMALTITATISAIATSLSSTDSSIPVTTSAPSTSESFSSTTTSDFSASSLTEATASFTTPASSVLSTSGSTSGLETSSTEFSSSVRSETTLSSSSTIFSDPSGRGTSSSAVSSSLSTRSTSSSSASGTATSTATAAAATEGTSRSELSTSGIAGIVTAAVVVAALLLGYLAYWFCIKKKGKKKRRSQRLTTLFTLPNGNDPTGFASPVNTTNPQGGLFATAMRRFYSNETLPQHKQSTWRGSAVPPNDIGIAIAPSTRVSPERRIDHQIPYENQTSWPSPAIAMQIDRSRQNIDESRWSPTLSYDEDIEAYAQAQNQDLPALGSPKTRASSRSFSSIVVEKPAPLRLSRSKKLPDAPRAGMMPLTPVYDNGTFESTIRQVVDGPDQPAGIIRLSRSRQSPNFSRREPPFTSTPQEDARPFNPQYREIAPHGRFPVVPMIPPRKQSETTDHSASIHTEIDDDSTPEEEIDKQLKAPQQAPLPVRMPLRDIQYPQIPRPAATSRQAEMPHSPRGITIRQVGLSGGPSPPEQVLTSRARKVKGSRNLRQTNTSSSSNCSTQSSESPIFPTPPTRLPGRPAPQNDLKLQISSAYRNASRPLTTATAASNSTRRSSEYPPSAYPRNSRSASAYDSPTVQRLSNGRPLAQRLQAQGYMPRPPQQPPMMRGPPRLYPQPIDPRSQDLYFTLDNMGR